MAAPLVTSTHEEADTYDSYSDSAEGDGEEVEGVVQVLPSASRPGPTEVRDILDDNYHMFRRKRAAAGHPVEDDEQVFYFTSIIYLDRIFVQRHRLTRLCILR